MISPKRPFFKSSWLPVIGMATPTKNDFLDFYQIRCDQSSRRPESILTFLIPRIFTSALFYSNHQAISISRTSEFYIYQAKVKTLF